MQFLIIRMARVGRLAPTHPIADFQHQRCGDDDRRAAGASVLMPTGFVQEQCAPGVPNTGIRNVTVKVRVGPMSAIRRGK